MTLDELVLHDFGAYGGRQLISLTPIDPAKPIVLFGGMNGGGKTTLLDAVQLCLYGSAAVTSNRGNLAYQTYLDRSIHRAPGVNDAAVEVAFTRRQEGTVHSFRVHRSWSRTANGCRENFHVLRNGERDDLATEHWSEQIEEFMPGRISNLFLFDGEKIEAYADFERVSGLIETAIHNLLGLDIVERLVGDLKIVERRKRSDAAPEADEAPIRLIAENVRDAAAKLSLLTQQQASLANDLDRWRSRQEVAEAEFRRAGGDLYERRTALEGLRDERRREVATLKVELRELAAGAAPLALLAPQLRALLADDIQGRRAHSDGVVADAIRSEHEAVLEIAGTVAPDGYEALKEALANRFAALAIGTADAANPLLSEDGNGLLRQLVSHGLDEVVVRLVAATSTHDAAARSLAQLEAEVSAVPPEEKIAELVAKRDAGRRGVETASREVATVEADRRDAEVRLDALRRQEEALLEKRVRMGFETEETNRMLDHSRRVRSTLSRFRDAVIARHISNIEALILESFGQLAGKERLVTSVRIDPLTFALDLTGRDGAGLTPERLSAGERQLLAVSILWGLAKASGLSLPTIIDTPLGRMDTVHRRNLVGRYFPAASHQVILLSTDREIDAGNISDLAPYIDRSYRLRHDADTARTVVEHGYFDFAA